MRIFGIGNDVAPVNRFHRLLERDEAIFLDRMFTQTEQHELLQYRSMQRRARACATSFAIKESVYKAIGTGLVEGMGWKDVEVSAIFGQCAFRVYGVTANLFERYHVNHWSVSCASTRELATAFTVLFTEETCYAN